MDDGMQPVLQQIAEQLGTLTAQAERAMDFVRKRDAAESARKAEALSRLEKDFPKFEMPEFPMPSEDHERTMRDLTERSREVQQQTQEYQNRLLAEFERLNRALEAILSRLADCT